MYDRIVTAALADTASKFRLAEALALDIPPRHRGPAAEGADDKTIPAYLEEASAAIITAGGEPRAGATLAHYRETALWVFSEPGKNFRWIAGRSFSAHNEARNNRMSYEEFAAMPKATVTLIRQQAGTAGTTDYPQRVAREWTPEQQAQVAREILARPDVAREVFADPDAAGDAVRAAYVPLGEAMRDHDQRRYRQAVPPGSREEKTRETEQRSIEVLEVLQRLHQIISSTGKLVSLGELSREQRELIAPLAQRAKVAVDYLAALDDDSATPSLSDDTIAEFLNKNS